MGTTHANEVVSTHATAESRCLRTIKELLWHEISSSSTYYAAKFI